MTETGIEFFTAVVTFVYIVLQLFRRVPDPPALVIQQQALDRQNSVDQQQLLGYMVDQQRIATDLRDAIEDVKTRQGKQARNNVLLVGFV